MNIIYKNYTFKQKFDTCKTGCLGHRVAFLVNIFPVKVGIPVSAGRQSLLLVNIFPVKGRDSRLRGNDESCRYDRSCGNDKSFEYDMGL